MNKSSELSLLERISELEQEVEKLREKLRWKNHIHEKHVNTLIQQINEHTRKITKEKQGDGKTPSKTLLQFTNNNRESQEV